MDFVHDTFADGTVFRVPTTHGMHTSERVALFAVHGLSGRNVANALEIARLDRGVLANCIPVDNGIKVTAKLLDQ